MPTLNEIHDWFEKLGIKLHPGFSWDDCAYMNGKLLRYHMVALDIEVARRALCYAAAEWIWSRENHRNPRGASMNISLVPGWSFADTVWNEIRRLAAQEPARE